MRKGRYEYLDIEEKVLMCLWVIVWLLICIFMALLLSGCTTTKYVEVPVVHNDTTYINKIQRDSIWLHDSVEVKIKGDSTLIEKWHTKYVEKQVHDTLYKAKTDTIAAPYPVEKLVEKQLSWWQKTRLYLGDIFCALLACVSGYGVWRLIRKFKIL